MPSLVSVIVATYNYGRFIAEALRSLQRQTFADWEAIIVDDGSTDETPAVVQAFLDDHRFHYRRIEHVGQSGAKNVGIRAARGRYVAFLDADDVWHPEKLARQLAVFERDPSLGVVYTGREWMTADGRPLERPAPTLYRGDVLRAIFRTNFVCFSSSMVRRDVFADVGLFDESLTLAVDYDLWLRIAARYRFDYVDAPLVRYRVGHASLSRRAVERAVTVMAIRRRFLARAESRRLPWSWVRTAAAQLHCSLALALRDAQPAAALTSYLKALVAAPWHGAAWKGLVSLAFSEPTRRRLRVALGRPADWRLPVEPAPPAMCLPPAGSRDATRSRTP
ncbi:MAG: glycosyltransferase [Gemmataceae bacterium]|nr:glycosyltransferase [Gemmataceae bacterium]MDW8265873.1 glycosyltransferase [Gemmataceae bacterium]